MFAVVRGASFSKILLTSNLFNVITYSKVKFDSDERL